MNGYHKILLAFFLLNGLTVFRGFGQLELKLEIKPRAEFRNGYKTPHENISDPAFFVEQRSRFYLSYAEEKLELNLSFQDVRIWGATSVNYKTDPSLTNVYEAWGKYKFNKNWSVKIGRQAIDYDNARFLGDADWSQQGRSHDAVLGTFMSSSGNLQMDAGVTWNQLVYEPGKLSGTGYFGVNNNKTMQYLWMHHKSPAISSSLLVHNNGVQTADTSMAFLQTFGSFLAWKGKKLEIETELYYQAGRNVSKLPVNAWFASVRISKKIVQLPFTLGVDYSSGTPADIADRDLSFNPLYGTNHKFYGFMDYFYVGNPHGQNQNITGLTDFYLKTRLNLSKETVFNMDLHYFFSPVAIYQDPGMPEEKFTPALGPEIDLVLIKKISASSTVWIGYSEIFPTPGLIALKGNSGDQTRIQNWAWIMIQFKPTIFSTLKN